MMGGKRVKSKRRRVVRFCCRRRRRRPMTQLERLWARYSVLFDVELWKPAACAYADYLAEQASQTP